MLRAASPSPLSLNTPIPHRDQKPSQNPLRLHLLRLFDGVAHEGSERLTIYLGECFHQFCERRVTFFDQTCLPPFHPSITLFLLQAAAFECCQSCGDGIGIGITHQATDEPELASLSKALGKSAIRLHRLSKRRIQR